LKYGDRLRLNEEKSATWALTSRSIYGSVAEDLRYEPPTCEAVGGCKLVV
jgi:hypothetical protein